MPHNLTRVVQMLLKMWRHPVITTDTSEKGLEDLIVAAMTGDRTSAVAHTRDSRSIHPL